MEPTTIFTIIEMFSRAYPTQFKKLSTEDKRKMLITWASAFGMFPDDHFITAAQLAVKKSPYLPNLNELGVYMRRAELLAQARAADEAHLRDGKTWAGAGRRSGEGEDVPRIGEASASSEKIAEAEELERVLLWLGDKPENAHATAWADIERRGTD